jgi:copper chaperone CopZ
MTMETITLKVVGMTCMGCVGSVQRLLQALPGVERVQVDLASGLARVDCDQSLADLNTLKRAIADGGFSVAD